VKPLGPIPAGFSAIGGELVIAGRTCRALVEEAGGTPLFAYSADMIRRRMADLRAAMPERLRIHYAMKANPYGLILELMATLADGGRIGVDLVHEEIERLRAAWAPARDETLERVLGPGQIAALDLFDRMQLQAVVAVCQRSSSLADAGRKLFAATRSKRNSINDSDRLRKYLARFDLEWARISERSL